MATQPNSGRALRLFAAVLAALFAAVAPTLAQTNQPRWPTLAQQLEQYPVIPGSALDRLIRENQQFDRLSSTELVNDKIMVPLWLRVFWRKAHPELTYSPNDPTGGYPLSLKEVWEWLLTHQDLKATPEFPATAGPLAKVATVAGDLRVSGAQTSPRTESNIRVNPRNPSLIIAGANNNKAGGNQAQFYSSDGGGSWLQTALPLQSTDKLHSDPTVEWTSEGVAWATTIGIDATTLAQKMLTYKSADSGVTWTFDSVFSGAQTATDKQMTWVDDSLISPYRDNMYAIWHNGTPVYMNRRTGGAWQTPVKVSGAETTGTGIGADVRTNSAGEVFGFWPDTGSRHLFVVKSTGGGATWSAPVTIATTFDAYDIGVPSMNARRVLIYTTAGAYRTASTSYAFVAWADLSGESGCTTAGDEPGSTTTSACKTRIWFSRSSNGGSTWSAPVMLNNQSSKNDQFNPWMVVDETNGRVAVMYYDTVADSGRQKTNVYYQSSANFGATWSTAVIVTTAQTDETTSGANGNQYGDYNGLSGLASVFFPSWTDRRNNAREEIWTAAITDSGGTGPDPSIQRWGADRVPPTAPWWQTSDIWVDNNLNGVPNEPGEPSRGVSDNHLFARITNAGNAGASGYRVTFKFIPFTTNAAAPATPIGSVDEPGTLAAGTSKNYTVPWDLSDAFIQTHFASNFWTADHFCVQVTVESSSASPLNDVNPANNFAQNNFDNVPVTKTKAQAKFFIYNHLDRAAIASLEARPRNAEWQTRFSGIADARKIPMQPKEWIEVVATLDAGANTPPPVKGAPALIDVTQRIDGAVVGGLTLALLPAELFPPAGTTTGSGRHAWYAGVSSGMNWPFGSTNNDFDPDPMFSVQLERDVAPHLRGGFQIGYHELDGGALANNLGVTNVSLYARNIHGPATGLQRYLLLGAGGYHVPGNWEAGLQAGVGLEVPVTAAASLTAGATAHFVNGGGGRKNLHWVDAYVGWICRLP